MAVTKPSQEGESDRLFSRPVEQVQYCVSTIDRSARRRRRRWFTYLLHILTRFSSDSGRDNFLLASSAGTWQRHGGRFSGYYGFFIVAIVFYDLFFAWLSNELLFEGRTPSRRIGLTESNESNELVVISVSTRKPIL
jgi:hypothetical protein